MSRCSNQKLKLLNVQKILLEQTDEQHPISVEEIINKLKALGIEAERKSIYDDIKALTDFGMDIQHQRQKPSGYYVYLRDFELAELKMLVDSVQAAKFITEKKTKELITKLTGLCSKHEANLLNRQLYGANRVKSDNEQIFYNIDGIYNAINQDKKICFKYIEFDLNKQKKFRRNEKMYCVSPFALIWEDERYYLLAYDSEAEIMKHYRVDKMESIDIAEEEREGKKVFAEIDVAEYTKRNFSMYSGELTKVRMQFHKSLIGIVIDKFGKGIMTHQVSDDYFEVCVEVGVSQVFYLWVFTFGDKAKIIHPEQVVNEAKEMLKRMLNQYES